MKAVLLDFVDVDKLNVAVGVLQGIELFLNLPVFFEGTPMLYVLVDVFGIYIAQDNAVHCVNGFNAVVNGGVFEKQITYQRDRERHEQRAKH